MAVNPAVMSMESKTGQLDPGAVDNRLTVNPNDRRWKFALDWEDGEEYNVKVKLRQISPGEFEVIAMKEFAGKPPEPTEVEPEEAEEEAEKPVKSKAPTKVNRAVADMEEEGY